TRARADGRVDAARIRVDQEIRAGQLVVEVAVDLGADRARRARTSRREVLDRVELEARVPPAHDAHALVLVDAKEQEPDRVAAAPDLEADLDVEEAALLEGAQLVGQVPG